LILLGLCPEKDAGPACSAGLARQKLPIAQNSGRPHLEAVPGTSCAGMGAIAMKIGETGGPRSVGGTRGTGRTVGAKGSDFAKLLDEAGKGADAVGAAAPAHAVGAIFGAQEVEDSTHSPSNGRAKQRANDMLDRLDALRAGLLSGTMSRGALMDLAQMVRAKPEAGADPRLKEILGEIELRAAVELAKLDMSR
jgi:hypothetical protein